MAPLVAKDTKPQLFSDMMWNDLLRDHFPLMTSIYDISQYQMGTLDEKKYAMLSLVNSIDVSIAERRALTFWMDTLSIKSSPFPEASGEVYLTRQIVVCK
jgi:hypothetical protein